MPKKPKRYNRAMALLVTVLTLTLFYYVFLIADRTKIFLYNHLAFTPDDFTTQSRYFMSGLVISGFVFFIYFFIKCISSQQVKWSTVFKHSALPIAVGITLITFFGKPAISLNLTMATVIFALAGLGLALYSADYLYMQRGRARHVLPAVISLLPLLTLFHAVEFYGHLSSVTFNTVVLVTLGSFVFPVAVLFQTSSFFRRKHLRLPPVLPSYILSLFTAYVVVPLIHFLLTPPGHKYITTADNFLAKNPLLQLFILCAACFLITISHLNYETKKR